MVRTVGNELALRLLETLSKEQTPHLAAELSLKACGRRESGKYI